MIYEKYPELKYKYRNREFWCRGYYVDTVGKNAKKIEEYIKHQLDEDKAGEQLTMGNFWVSWARLRAASNKPMQVSDRTNATWRVASNRGLRPSKKNPRLRRGIIIDFRQTVQDMKEFDIDGIYPCIASIIVMIINDNRHVKELLRDIWLLFG